jgi:hypothetical protein
MAIMSLSTLVRIGLYALLFHQCAGSVYLPGNSEQPNDVLDINVQRRDTPHNATMGNGYWDMVKPPTTMAPFVDQSGLAARAANLFKRACAFTGVDRVSGNCVVRRFVHIHVRHTLTPYLHPQGSMLYKRPVRMVLQCDLRLWRWYKQLVLQICFNVSPISNSTNGGTRLMRPQRNGNTDGDCNYCRCGHYDRIKIIPGHDHISHLDQHHCGHNHAIRSPDGN